MKIFKTIFWVLIILMIIPLIASLFIKNDYKVLRAIIIDKPKNQVFNYIKLLKNQEYYSKWAKLDPKMEKKFIGIDGTIGFVSAWKSKQKEVGVGEQEIIGIIEGERIDYELRFKEPFESVSKAYLLTETSAQDKTKVSWGFVGNLDYPMNFMLLFTDFENMIGDDLAIGLSNLKQNLEHN